MAELGSEYGVHPAQISQWKKQMLSGLPSVFGPGKSRDEKEDDALRDDLYREIGRLKRRAAAGELDWVKKNLELELEVLRGLVEPEHRELSIGRQCELLGIARSSYYYEACEESQEDLRLKRLLDEQYLKTPFYGSRRMTAWLETIGHNVNRKRVQRLMREMGWTGPPMRAIYPKPKTTEVDPEHRKYSYLLRGLLIDRPNQIWSTDITYIPMRKGFLYLTAVLDWYSRYVLSWTVSNSLETSFCVEALEKALSKGCPEIFNTKQGGPPLRCQYTSRKFTGPSRAGGVQNEYGWTRTGPGQRIRRATMAEREV